MDYYDYAKIRDERGFNDRRVATLAGIPASTFSDWKSGRSVPKLDKLKKIAMALGVTYSKLSGERDEELEAYLEEQRKEAMSTNTDNPKLNKIREIAIVLDDLSIEKLESILSYAKFIEKQ